MVMGSSGPAPFISCISALPMDVTRSVTCMGWPSTVPSQEPASDFSCSKDFCAADCAKPALETSNTARGSMTPRIFMFRSSSVLTLKADALSGFELNLYGVVVKHNTKPHGKHFFWQASAILLGQRSPGGLD